MFLYYNLNTLDARFQQKKQTRLDISKKKDRKREQGGREVMLNGDSRKTERAKDRTESGLEECHGPESSPRISTQYPLLSPKIMEGKQGKPREVRGRHEHNKQMCRLARA